MTNLAERMMSLFAGNEAAYGFYGEPVIEQSGKASIRESARTLREPVTVDHWHKHLSGKRPLGVIPIRGDGTCSWGCIDVDDYQVDHVDIIARVEELKLPLVPTRSKSGGLHLTLFLTSPAPVREVIAALTRMAADVGVPGSEIFPKQDKIDAERGDAGNWITVPYGTTFDGKLRDQVGLDVDGRALTLEEFVEAAERSMIDPEKLAGFTGGNRANGAPIDRVGPSLPLERPEGEPWFWDGPPCLEKIAKLGLKEGERNQGLHAIAVYAKKKDPQSLPSVVEAANREFMKPPLDISEVAGVVKSNLKRDYNYSCSKEPLKSRCNSPVCCVRPYGVSDNEFSISKVEKKFVDDKPVWTLVIEPGGHQVEITDVKDLTRPLNFREQVLAKTNVLLPLIKVDAWHAILRGAIANVQIISNESIVKSLFKELLRRFCVDSFPDSHTWPSTREDLIARGIWRDDGGSRYVFKRDRWLSYLASIKAMPHVDSKTLHEWLREAGAVPGKVKVKGDEERVWMVSFDAPLIRGEEDRE